MATVTKLGVAQQPGEVPCSRLFERHFSPAKLAQQWNLSEDTVRRIFEREPDVPIFENLARGSSRRRRKWAEFQRAKEERDGSVCTHRK
jgi:AraC-like DNA-binding protein